MNLKCIVLQVGYKHSEVKSQAFKENLLSSCVNLISFYILDNVHGLSLAPPFAKMLW